MNKDEFKLDFISKEDFEEHVNLTLEQYRKNLSSID